MAFVREALAAAARQNAATDALLAAAGIDPALLQQPAARVSPAAFGALWLAIAATLDDEFFGLDSRRMKVGSFAALSRLTLPSRNLREVLVRAAQFFRVLLDDTAVELRLAGPEAAIVLSDRFSGPAGEALERRIFAHETLLVMLHGLACWLIARRIPVRRAAFAYPRPAWADAYPQVFAQELVFDAPQTCIEFSAVYLQAPVEQNARSLSEFLRGAPGNFILKYKDENSLASRVRRQLRSLPPASWPSFEQLADEWHLSATTLRRRLDREGASFSGIKDALRRDLAIRHLAESEVSIVDIAVMLGFAEPSAFHRAFKQWTGLRPGAYREALRVEAR